MGQIFKCILVAADGERLLVEFSDVWGTNTPLNVAQGIKKKSYYLSIFAPLKKWALAEYYLQKSIASNQVPCMILRNSVFYLGLWCF